MKVIVVGSYGYTGTLVCENLEALGIPYFIGGRNPDKLIKQYNEIFSEGYRVLDLHDQNSLDLLVDQFDILINCVGPFSEFGYELPRKVAEKGSVYIDITGELGYVDQSLDRNGPIALASGASLIHACAFESALAMALGNVLIQDMDQVNSLQAYYLLNHARLSPGSKLTMKLSPFYDTFFYEKGRKSSLQAWPQQKIVLNEGEEMVAIPYPLPEVALFHKDCQDASVASFLLILPGEAAFFRQKTPPKEGQKERILARGSRGSGPSPEQRKQLTFLLLVSASNTNGTQQIWTEGSDTYFLSGKIAAYAVKQFIDRPSLKGVLGPGDLFMNKEKELLAFLNIPLHSTSLIQQT